MNDRTAAELEIALGLLLAIASGTLAVSGHGLAATTCALATIALGLHAYRQPV